MLVYPRHLVEIELMSIQDDTHADIPSHPCRGCFNAQRLLALELPYNLKAQSWTTRHVCTFDRVIEFYPALKGAVVTYLA